MAKQESGVLEDIARQIKIGMAELDITNDQEFADRCQISRPHLSLIKNAKTAVTTDTLLKIGEGLGKRLEINFVEKNGETADVN